MGGEGREKEGEVGRGGYCGKMGRVGTLGGVELDLRIFLLLLLVFISLSVGRWFLKSSK